MRYKLTLVLIVLNILVYYLVVHLERKSITGAEHAGNIFGLFSSEVVTIERLEIGGNLVGETRVLEREGRSWLITRPVYWPANYFAVQRILTQLQFLKAEARFSVEEIKQSGQSLADYGLDNPSLVFSFGVGGAETRIKIGVPTEFGGRLYILGPNEQDVYVVSRTFLESLIVDLEDLRDAEVFNIPLFEVNSLTIQVSGRSKVKMRLIRTDGKWGFEAPIQISADNRRVDSVLAQLESLTVLKFMRSERDDWSLYGLVDPAMKVTIQGNNRRQTLLLGDRVEGAEKEAYYYARLESIPTVFTLEASLVDSFKNAQEILRNRKIFTAELNEPSFIRVKQSGHLLSLNRLEDGSWQGVLDKPGGEPVRFLGDSQIIAHSLGLLSHLEVVRFVSDAPSEADLERFGFADPQREIIVGSDEEQILLVGDVDISNKLLYAKRADLPYVYEVPLRVLDDFPLDPLFYKNRVIEELPASSQIKSLTFKNQEKGEKLIQLNVKKGGTFKEAAVGLPESKRQAVADILHSLEKLEVKSFLELSFDASGYQLDASTKLPWVYSLEVTVISSENEAPSTMRYYFSERLGGSLQIGGSPQSGVVFTLKQALVDALNALVPKLVKPDIEKK